jgi:hypothetical protein
VMAQGSRTFASECAPVHERSCSASHPWPRRGQPWTPAEDARLLVLVKEGMEKYPNKTIFSYKDPSPAGYAAEILGRTASAVMTRYQMLQVCKKRECGGQSGVEPRD